mmetsp:Transcript_11554/g.24545  ORF Transcript_11554/g.24545 Transcript_11554/m.24545 type:complete len:215 (-) Transcript_11554:807-1451(-)
MSEQGPEQQCGVVGHVVVGVLLGVADAGNVGDCVHDVRGCEPFVVAVNERDDRLLAQILRQLRVAESLDEDVVGGGGAIGGQCAKDLLHALNVELTGVEQLEGMFRQQLRRGLPHEWGEGRHLKVALGEDAFSLQQDGPGVAAVDVLSIQFLRGERLANRAGVHSSENFIHVGDNGVSRSVGHALAGDRLVLDVHDLELNVEHGLAGGGQRLAD